MHFLERFVGREQVNIEDQEKKGRKKAAQLIYSERQKQFPKSGDAKEKDKGDKDLQLGIT